MKNSFRDSINSLNVFLNNYFVNQSQIEVLEAGCGSCTHIETMKKFQITGIDISQRQLDRNSHISKKICGDIQEYKFICQSFDLIISWYVLEHVRYPKKAMKNLIGALRPNGLLILALPNLWSVKGLVTKLTPTKIHVWFYKNILKMENAGKDEVGPFKTYLKTAISPLNIKKFALENQLELVFFKFITNENMYKRTQSNLFTYIIQELFTILIFVVSLGKVQKKNTDFLISLKKA